VFGYLLAYGRPRKDKIAITIGNAYMNNGMAIVLAAAYFEPSILVLAILSEFPWNTLLGVFRRVLG
jgi:predicted Na+-dependent transporter